MCNFEFAAAAYHIILKFEKWYHQIKENVKSLRRGIGNYFLHWRVESWIAIFFIWVKYEKIKFFYTYQIIIYFVRKNCNDFCPDV